MAGSILFPDVESYTKSVVFCLGKTNETTGYWSHGIQVSVNVVAQLFSIHFKNGHRQNDWLIYFYFVFLLFLIFYKYRK